MRQWKTLLFSILLFISVSAFAQKPIAIKMYKATATGRGHYIGVVIAKDTRLGLLLVPRLKGLSPGHHGFHIHEYPFCKNFAKAAGGHWDPRKTGRHRGPFRPGGHLGDLPRLHIGSNGEARHSVLAPRLTTAEIKNHALIIHLKGDNYSDRPVANGGGGLRIACGIVH